MERADLAGFFLWVNLYLLLSIHVYLLFFFLCCCCCFCFVCFLFWFYLIFIVEGVSKLSDEPAHPSSLTGALIVCTHKSEVKKLSSKSGSQ